MPTATKRIDPTKAPEGEGLRHVTCLVNAKEARFWLDHNAPNNRGPKNRKMKSYAHDMLEGNWRLTGEAIGITEDEWVDADLEPRRDPRMIDGGQRMRSLLLAAEKDPEIEVKFTFAWGLPYDAIFVTNTGSARTFADGLGFKGRTNRNNLGAIVRRVWYWDHGNYVATGGSNTPDADPTMQDLHELEEEHTPELRAATARALDFKNSSIGNPTAAGTAYYVLNRLDHEDAVAFFDQLVSGANLSERSPVLTLRNRLLMASSAHSRAQSLTTTEQLYLIMRSWNAFRLDEDLDTLLLPPRRSITNSKFIRPV